MAEHQHDSRPIPDPTELTTDALRRDVNSLRELLVARMDGTDRLNDERFTSRQKALEAALAAAEKAVAKAESATKERIDGLGETFNATTAALADKIDGVKERVTEIEGHKRGALDGWGLIVGVVGMIGALLAIGAMVYRR